VVLTFERDTTPASAANSNLIVSKFSPTIPTHEPWRILMVTSHPVPFTDNRSAQPFCGCLAVSKYRQSSRNVWLDVSESKKKRSCTLI